MVTLRNELTARGFNWATGCVIYQHLEGGVSLENLADALVDSRVLAHDDPIFDKEYIVDNGAPHMPCIIAIDGTALYFPGQYDGTTWIKRVEMPVVREQLAAFDNPIPVDPLLRG